MECPSCHSPWSSEDHIPRILPCGHTICESCCISRFIYSKILCQECNTYHKFEIDRDFSDTDDEFLFKCINTLSKNFTLLSIINSNKGNDEKIEEFEFEYCEEHNLPLHSLTVKPDSLLCDICVEEVSEMGLEIRSLEYVEVYFNGIIEKALENLRGKKRKIENVIERIEFYDADEGEKAEESVSQYFDELLEFVNRNELELEKKVEIKGAELKGINGKIQVQLGNIREELVNFQAKFEYLSYLAEDELVRNTEICDSLALASNSTNLPNIGDLKSLQFSSNKAKIAKLSNLLEGSYKILLKKCSDTWTCIKCQKTNQDGSITCFVCKHFRPISTYPRLSTHPLQASEQELHELNLRRQLEIQKISQLDKIDHKGRFFLIHTGWFNKWKEFVLSKNTEKKQAVVLPPGQISNHLLFEDEQFKVIKSNLRAVNDYRGLNEEVWKAYVEIYGGGPEIMRKKLNIYE